MLPLQILRPLIQPFRLCQQTLVFLGSSQNHVYRARSADGSERILRVSAGRFRTRDEVMTELRWLGHLVQRGIPACAPIPAVDGELCVSRRLGDADYLAVCFELAPGLPVSPKGPDWAAFLPFYETLGTLLGQLHRESVRCDDRCGPPWQRAHWYESRLLRQDVACLGDRLSAAFRQSVTELVDDLHRQPAMPEHYGLIHGDVSFSNCHFHERTPWIFDFDNCEYGFFLQDVATVLYDSIYCKVLNQFADAGLTARMVPLTEAFLGGYAKTGVLKEVSPARLRQFFLLREAVIYVHYHRTLKVEDLPDSFTRGMEVMRRNVEAQEHQVDFASLPLG